MLIIAVDLFINVQGSLELFILLKPVLLYVITVKEFKLMDPNFYGLFMIDRYIGFLKIEKIYIYFKIQINCFIY
jgi:hypothetical protein